ncbi:MAG: diaminopimelate epimerase [Actinomycetia bacterium]|nr:diaminopimelate epimerase [Actinomycetes bacterium]
MTLHLSKLHATGNDFLVLDALDADPGLDAVSVAALCDRHRGIGADGVLTLSPGRDGADCTMTLVNADGGLAEMSGNGVRCLAYVAAHRGLGTESRLVVDTAGGRRVLDLFRNGDGRVHAADVDMGPATFEPAKIPIDVTSPFDLEATVHGTTYRGDAAGMGNPHLVLFVDDPLDARVTQHGPRLEHDPRVPRRTNVEFVSVSGPDALHVRVWERGVGETLSCGTGACAAAAVAHRRGLVSDHVTVHVAGGVLNIALGDTVHLGGPVVHVFDVDVDRDRLLRSLA